LIFQIDLFSARGMLPRDIEDVMARHKDIMYSSRTRNNTDVYRRLHTPTTLSPKCTPKTMLPRLPRKPSPKLRSRDAAPR
jgi:NTE family protein